MNNFIQAIDSIEAVIGSYRGLVVIVTASYFIKIVFGTMASIKNHNFKTYDFFMGIGAMFLMGISMEFFAFAVRFLREGEDYALFVLALLTAILLIAYNLLKTYMHWADLAGRKINKLEKILSENTKETANEKNE